MSTETKASGQLDQVSDEIEKKEDKVSFQTYSKLLSEKKKRDQEVAEYKAQIEAIAQKELESQGKFKEINDSLKKQLAEKDLKIKNMVKDFGGRTLKTNLELEAKNMGCLDTELLFGAIDLSSVDIGENFDFNQDQLKSVLSDFQKKKPLLFKKDVIPAKDATPNSSKSMNGNLDVSKMSHDDLKKMLAMKLAKN